MAFREHAVVFPCEGETLVGILALPERPAPPTDVGLVVIVGGPQYRVGSHRQFLDLSRRIATAGVAVLRFDVRGMGDSTGDLHNFETISLDIAAAIDALQFHAPHVRRIALWGLCDGASAALLYLDANRDARVRGLCLLNPWVRSEASLAKAHVKHYYRQRLRQKEFWIKLLSGRVTGEALSGLWRSLRILGAATGSPTVQRDQPFQLRMERNWRNFDGQILLLLSENDYTAKEFLEYAAMNKGWAGVLQQTNVMRCDLKDADHTFSNVQTKAQVATLTLDWLRSALVA